MGSDGWKHKETRTMKDQDREDLIDPICKYTQPQPMSS